MTPEKLQEELISAGLHEESVERMLHHFEKMRFHLSNSSYREAQSHVGTFCENAANIIRVILGQDPLDSLKIGTFVNEVVSDKYGQNAPDEIRLTVPRFIRAAYDVRNDRDSVHMNLRVAVNKADTQAAVRICSWILAEFIRNYGDEDDMDKIAEMIENLADPIVPYVDQYKGVKMVMSTDLDLGEEILVHLLSSTGEAIDANSIVKGIPGADGRKVKGSLGRMKQDRLVWYDPDSGKAKITPLGAEKAREIVAENFVDEKEF